MGREGYWPKNACRSGRWLKCRDKMQVFQLLPPYQSRFSNKLCTFVNKSAREGLKTIQETETAPTLTAERGFLYRLKEKWGLQSLMQVVAVLAVFTLTGSTVVWIRRFLFDVLGFDDTTPFWLKTVTYLLFIMPFYQLLLLAYGFLLGQFSFFWEKEKKLARRIGRAFRRA
jgi:hypothetical protein